MAVELRKVISMPQQERSETIPSAKPPAAPPAWVDLPIVETPQSAAPNTEQAEGLQRALNALHAGRLIEAMEDLRALSERDPEGPEAPFFLGCVEQRRGNAEEARSHYLRAIELAPLAWQPLFNLALLSIDQRGIGEARQMLERAALLAPEVAEVRWRLAVLCEQCGEETEARHWYESVALLDPEHAGARFRLGMLALRKGDLDLAAAHLQSCQSGHPDAASAAYHLGLIHFHAARWREARSALERACQAGPHCREFLLALGALALAENDLERAERLERELRELDFDSAELSYNLARAWQERGQPERARRHYKHAVDRDPSLAHGYFR